MSFNYGFDRDNLIDVVDSPRVKLFRMVEQLLRGDSALSSVVRTFRAWAGKPADYLFVGYGEAPAIVMELGPSEESWWIPWALKGRMTIALDLVIPGSAVDDLDNLWNLIVTALRPRSSDAWDDLYKLLVANGAWKGTIDVERTAFDAREVAGRDRGFRGGGTIIIDYIDVWSS